MKMDYCDDPGIGGKDGDARLLRSLLQWGVSLLPLLVIGVAVVLGQTPATQGNRGLRLPPGAPSPTSIMPAAKNFPIQVRYY